MSRDVVFGGGWPRISEARKDMKRPSEAEEPADLHPSEAGRVGQDVTWLLKRCTAGVLEAVQGPDDIILDSWYIRFPGGVG